ncbi:DUF4148 domain-containing protein [Hydrogenophaga sp.]|uniref:DUF4148 domain-containing protein n=1 Tax=Hydrogenophaga sp. TaxID=1904254 RepID=UPI00262255C5|nr:DUF4148 domain-containing protein [Hydrogenophaga sp.]MCW5655798.1 DUF4148 domain-containing protein [Hydrogenophaga sp.]
MNTAQRILLPVAFALTAGAAFAEGPIQGNEVFGFHSTLSRAEVQAQAVQARDAGLIVTGEAQPEAGTAVAYSGVSRAQVQAEAAEANRLGLVARGEILPQATPAQAEQVRLAGLRAVQGRTVVQGVEGATRVN